MQPMRILVTGCGRSGTQYTARVLSELGLRTTHEKVYNHDLDPLCPDWDEIAKRWEGKDAECSWLAVPFLRNLPDDVMLWHQLRDPLKIIRCWLCHHLLVKGEPGSQFVYKVLPKCDEGLELERAVHYVIRWNQMIEDTDNRNCCTYRIEDLTPERMVSNLYASDVDRSIEQCRKVIDDVSKTTGTCGHGENDGPTWHDVLSVQGGLELWDMARRWGYV